MIFLRVRTVGVDAHVLTGKYQGSRAWLEGVLSELPNIDRVNRYILYSEDPAACAECARRQISAIIEVL